MRDCKVALISTGGTPTPITTLHEESNERSHRWPHVLPDGDAVLFTVGFLNSSESYEMINYYKQKQELCL